jgi:hypothetical protein
MSLYDHLGQEYVKGNNLYLIVISGILAFVKDKTSVKTFTDEVFISSFSY